MNNNEIIYLTKNIAKNNIALIILLFELIIFLILSPIILVFSNIRNMLMVASIDGLIAIGVTFIIISGGLDLSIGINKAFSAIISIITLKMTGNIFLSILTGVLVGTIVGFINGIIITKGRINPFIATLGTYLILNGLAIMITQEGTINVYNINYMNITAGMLFYLNFPIFIFILVFIIAYFLLHKSIIGKYIFSIGGDEQVSMLFGVNINKYKIITYTLCGSFCGIAGVFLASRAGAAGALFGQYTMFVVVGAVILGGNSLRGGEGGVTKSIIGLFIYILLQNGFGMLNVSPYYQFFIWGGLLVIITCIDSWRHGTIYAIK